MTPATKKFIRQIFEKMEPEQMREKNRINEGPRQMGGVKNYPKSKRPDTLPQFYSLKDRKWHNSPDENNSRLDPSNPPQGTIRIEQKYSKIYYRTKNEKWKTIKNSYMKENNGFFVIESIDDKTTRLIKTELMEEVRLIK